MSIASRPIDPKEALDPWEIAKTRFLEGLDENERTLFNEATIENLYYGASNVERKDKKESRTRRILGTLQPLLSAVEDYGKALDTYANIAPTYLAPIWGSIRVVLAIASSFERFYGRMVDMFGRIGDILPRFRDFQKIFDVQKYQRFNQALAAAYLDIIVLCTEFRTLLQDQKKSTVKRLFQPVSPALNSHLQEAIVRFRNHRKKVEKEAELCHMIEEKEARDLVLRNTEAAKARERESRQKRLISQISTIDYQYKHRRMQKVRHPGTGAWFITLPAFKEWLDSNSSSVLCCHGIPGSGKSVLVSSIIDYLVSSKTPKASTVFYYCNHTDKRTLDPLNIFKSLTQQLLQSLGDLPESLLSFIEETFPHDSYVPDLDEIFRLLLAVIHQCSSTTIIIDGIDEVAEDKKALILSQLKNIVRDGRPNLLKLLISGREDNTDALQIREIPGMKIRITADTIAGDIGNYVRSAVRELIRIGDLKVGDSVLEDEIILALTAGAKGMFLWVKFQLDELCAAQTDNTIRKVLRNLPRDLGETYERLLMRIQGEEIRQFIHRMFEWIIFAKRPLVAEELREAIAFTPDDTQWDAGKIPNDLLRLVRISGHLFMVDEETGVVQLAHYTVQQYLLDPKRALRSGFALNLEDGDCNIGRICVAYLSFSDFETQITRHIDTITPGFAAMERAMASQSLMPNYNPGSKVVKAVKHLRGRKPKPLNIEFTRYIPKSNPPTVDLIQKYCLLSYVANNWLYHTVSLNTSNDPTMAKFTKLVLSKKLLFDFRPWGQVDVESKDSLIGQTPLSWAVQNGHQAVVKLLLETGEVDVESKDGLYGQTPLSWAARNGHEAVVKLLLETGEVDVESKDGLNGQTPLWWAARNGHEAVVKLLLETGQVDVESKDSLNGQTPLSLAAQNRHEAVVKLLLETG
ncbi:hypothetical protein BP6252_11829 [Coleophoma cylindrospora]|uniref:NACHT domain-containing protein n=1 Tax=Coleophoma cylindrospora TaxID=1849047 RepID=A0A3D8QKP1_9HELO|nr:hypothetical protein BP6252_11829 [Coleophoma cylindrospora]